MKRLREMFTTINSGTVIAEEHGFNFEKLRRFGAGLQDVVRTYRELYDKMCLKLSSQACCRISRLPHLPRRLLTSIFDIGADKHRKRCKH